MSDSLRARIEAYHDGELGPLARLAVGLRIRVDPRARAELDAVRRVGDLVRALDAEADAGPVPDLWPELALRLPPAVAPVAERRRVWSAAPWAAAGAALAAALAAVLLQGGEPDPAGSVRWLDARGRPMMVLRDDAEATIIWLPDEVAEGASRKETRHGLG